MNRICWNIWIIQPPEPPDLGGAIGTIPGFPEVPADLDNFTFDASSFPDFPDYLNSGPPTSPATTAFIDDYLNAPTSPQGLLGFEGGPVLPAGPAHAPATVVPVTAPEVVPEVVTAPHPTENGKGRVRRSLTTSFLILSNTRRLTAPQDLKYVFTNPKVVMNLKTYYDPTRSGSTFSNLNPGLFEVFSHRLQIISHPSLYQQIFSHPNQSSV
jgi:hypothetical protein